MISRTAVVVFSLLASQACAFAPYSSIAFGVKKPSTSRLFMAEETIEEEAQRMAEEELAKTKKFSNLRNEKGVEYAPWMKISKEEEAKILQVMKERAIARRMRQEQEQDVKGSLLLDSQAQELSGTGLQSKVIDGTDVELTWATSSEVKTAGFLVKRRAAKTETFATIASYETYGPLASKGPDGGVYRYLDADLQPGSYVYRITECQADGSENDLSQCLVDVQTAEEQRGAVIAAVGIVLVGILAVVAGELLDPVQY